jgi:ferredoxin
MQDYFILTSETKKLLDFLEFRYNLYVIKKKDEHLYWRRFVRGDVDEVIINEHRAAEPLKGFIFKSKERVASSSPKPEGQKKRPCAIVGAKACDLHALKILDYVFIEGEFKDPFYIDARQNTLILSADCTSYRDVCFCLGIGVEPFPEQNFDLNFSTLEDGYIITIGSDKGERLLKESRLAVSKVTERQREKSQRDKKDFLKKLRTGVTAMRLPSQDSLKDVVCSHYKSGIWDTFAERCVECGGCNTVCPTCHCFLLVDQGGVDRYQRLKVWDSCLLKRFARVAGGANPRKHLHERLRNRFNKKFDFFPAVLSLYACTGCGRCIEACPGDIDIREVLKELGKK